MRNLILEPLASDDLAQSIAFYDRNQYGMGMEFMAEVKDMLRKIADNPRLYATFHRTARRALLTRFHHFIIYQFDDENVYVVGVMHTSRDPRQFRGRVRRQP